MRFNGFRDRRLRPLGHLSMCDDESPTGGIVTSPTGDSSAGGKELFKQTFRLVFTNPGDNVAPVVEAFILGDVEQTPHTASLEVGGCIDDTVDTCPHRSHRTHRTRLESYNKGVAGQSPIASLGGGRGEDQHLSMCGCVPTLFTTVVVGCNNNAAGIEKDGTNWDITMINGESRLGKGQVHC